MKRIFRLLPVLLFSVLLVLVATLVQPLQIEETAYDRTALQPAPRQEITNNTQLLAASFPARVLALADGSGFGLTGGVCQDFTFNGQPARRATLRWQNEAGGVITCVSMVPAETITLASAAGLRIASPEPVTVGGIAMVKMIGSDVIRLHATAHGAAYVLTAEGISSEELTALLPYTIITAVNQSGEGS